MVAPSRKAALPFSAYCLFVVGNSYIYSGCLDPFANTFVIVWHLYKMFNNLGNTSSKVSVFFCPRSTGIQKYEYDKRAPGVACKTTCYQCLYIAKQCAQDIKIDILFTVFPILQADGPKSNLFLTYMTYVRNKVGLVPLACEDTCTLKFIPFSFVKVGTKTLRNRPN